MGRRIKRPFIETPSEKAAFLYGIQLAAEIAKDYDKYSYHSHLVSECILAKLNVRGRPHKNPWAAKIMKALDSLDRKVGNLEGTARFMALAAKNSTGFDAGFEKAKAECIKIIDEWSRACHPVHRRKPYTRTRCWQHHGLQAAKRSIKCYVRTDVKK